MTKTLFALGSVGVTIGVLAVYGCSSSSGGGGELAGPPALDSGTASPEAGSGSDSAATDAPSPVQDSGAGVDGQPPASGLAFTCAATKAAPKPNACPASSGKPGEVSFCYRPEWAGVTGVDVYGGFGQAGDWKTPFVTLANDGSGTFTATTALAAGTYPYVFRSHGSDDNLVQDGHYFLDQHNPSFVPAPAGAPHQRSVSAITVPQSDAPVVHLKGTVLFDGVPQPCYSVDLEAGEVIVGGKVKSEHDTANFAESAPDGTFDFTVASGVPYGAVVRFPFLLSGADAGYPDPTMVPSVAYARTSVTVSQDMTLDPLDVRYPIADYVALSPTSGTATLPVTFKFTLVPGAAAANVAVIGTSVPGNDPAFWSPFATTTTVTWDGTFGGTQGTAKPGTKYYWGTWQRRDPLADGGASWSMESFLYPITFQ